MAKQKSTPQKDDDFALAQERYLAAVNYDKDNTDQAADDLEFTAGPGQWDENDKLARKGRPCLTVNQLPQFVMQVVGDMRQNAPSIKVMPAEDGDKDIAEIRSGLIRSIEQRCDAQGVYTQAAEHQVICGQGNWRIRLDYGQELSFDQEIMIEGFATPLAVVWDPMSIDRTGRDAMFCFVKDDIPRDEFMRRFPDAGVTPMNGGSSDTDSVLSDWNTRDTVRIAEYWEVKTKDVLLFLGDDGQVVDATDWDKELVAAFDPSRTRKAKKRYVSRRLMNGTQFLDDAYELPISRLPIIRVVGRITDTGKKRYREGLIRQAKDAQRLKNYWRSTAAELLAMQPKAFWLASARSVQGREDDFRDAAQSGDPLLIHNDGDVPRRMDPVQFPAAIHQEAQINTDDMKALTGIYDSSIGARSNETSGKAIIARERQGDVATYIYHDNWAASVRETGRVINELIPLVYDTPRTIRVLGDDMTAKIMRVNDPNDPSSQVISVGAYDVVITTGPSYATKRAESAENMMKFVQAIPQVGAVAGDLIVGAQDWPMADQIAARIKSQMPPGVADDDEERGAQPNPQAQQAMQAAQMQSQIAQAQAKADIDKANAQAREAIAKAELAELRVMQMQMQMQAMAQNFGQGVIGSEQPAFDQGSPSF